MPILKREPDAFPESVFEMSDPWWVARMLFAGYVFFRGGRDERPTLKSNVVINVLEPQDQAEIDAELRQLHQQGVARLVVSVSFIRQSVALDIDREFIRPQRRL